MSSCGKLFQQDTHFFSTRSKYAASSASTGSSNVLSANIPVSSTRYVCVERVVGNDISLHCKIPLSFYIVERFGAGEPCFEIIYEPLCIHVYSESASEALLDVYDLITAQWVFFTIDPNRKFGNNLSVLKRIYMEHFEQMK